MQEAAETLILLSRGTLAPPNTPVDRQLTLDKWKRGEEFMTMNPTVREYIVEQTHGHIYKLVRTHKGRLARIHETIESRGNNK